ncbi:Uncharacterised protein [Clostridium putrefaciens]|uniref:Uncharacterized protein n=1 Tax=Clostridium putrefaciens TaxID=99675 RepID=A0A381J734_9CLOT|nr:hypothetical protein [Clostridium putrefaciens]SUY45930.1 Uncharacterised protein [Clostridium putrefaciens]
MKNRNLEQKLKILTWILIIMIFSSILIKPLTGNQTIISILLGVLFIIIGIRGFLINTVLIGRNDVNLDYKEGSVIGKIANMVVILVGVTVIIFSIIKAI